MIKNKMLKASIVTCSLLMLMGCGKKADVATNPDATANPTVTTEASNSNTSNDPTSEPTTEPTTEPTAEPTPTVDPEEWKYKIVQNGYYNAAATWDENGSFVSAAEVKPGNVIYYNDNDEYYDNFISKKNVFGGAELALDDLVAHSGDNSIKVTNRLSETDCFSGFALMFTKDNGFSDLWKESFNATLDMWIYYQDDLSLETADTLKFAIWNNHPSDADIESAIQADSITAEITDDVLLRNAVNRLFKKAASINCYCVKIIEIPKNTWTRVKIPVSFKAAEDTKRREDTWIGISTVNEKNSNHISFYNPFYVDDIVLTVNE